MYIHRTVYVLYTTYVYTRLRGILQLLLTLNVVYIRILLHACLLVSPSLRARRDLWLVVGDQGIEKGAHVGAHPLAHSLLSLGIAHHLTDRHEALAHREADPRRTVFL